MLLQRFGVPFFLAITLFASSIVGQNLWLEGRVFRPNGQPLEQSIRVEVRNPRASVATVDTSSSGAFSFLVASLGQYVFVAEAGEEYEPATVTLMIDELFLQAIGKGAEHTSWVNIYLKPKDRTAVVASSTLDAKLANVPKKALDLYGKGLKLASANKFAEASLELQKAIQIHPAFYQAQTELGKVYLKLSSFPEAADAFHSALATEPNNFEARLHLAMALLNQKKFAEALPEYVAAADLDKTSVTPHYYVGVIKYEAGEPDSSIAAFEHARSLNGDKPYPMLHKYLASLYLKKQRWSDAVAEMEKYLEQSPDAADAEQIRKLLADARSRIK